MKPLRITLPELMLVAGTRAALGVGVGLLISSRYPSETRKAVGKTLVLIGALTTIPLAFEVLGGRAQQAGAESKIPQGAPQLRGPGPLQREREYREPVAA